MKKELKHHRKKYDHVLKWLIILFLLIVMLVATGFFIYHFKKTSMLANLMSPSPTLQTKTQNKSDIHFEFYTTLPNMQMNVQEIKEANAINKGKAKPKQLLSQNLKIFDEKQLEKALKNEIKHNRK